MPTPRLVEPLRKALGTRTANLLATLDLHTVSDLLHHYPRRIASPGTLTDLGSLVPGESALVWARVVSATVRPMRSRRGALMTVTITDGHHVVPITFFARAAGALRGQETRFVPGREGWFSGAVSEYRGSAQFVHATAHFVGPDGDSDEALDLASRPVPVYPASAKVSQFVLGKAVRTVLDTLQPEDLPDVVPEPVRAAKGWGTALETMRAIHHPNTEEDWYRARDALRFEEAFVLQAELARRRAKTAREPATARPGQADGILTAFDARLPFELTAGQRRIGEDLATALAAQHPMHRLLQGDVGSGKTVVALRAMLQVVDSGGQAALLAPTEVLATQHAHTLDQLLGPLAHAGELDGAENATRIALLTGSTPAAKRRPILADIASGAAGIVVGTHALLQDTVVFDDLGLVVVDEQHRFGVRQRDALRAKARQNPHLLVMTATPIPRTIAMTAFGDLDVSRLTDRPIGRAPVATHVVPEHDARWRQRMWQRAREELDAGHRVFIVCPRIDPSDTADDGGAPVAGDLTVAAEPPAGDLPVTADFPVASELPATAEPAGRASTVRPRSVLEMVAEIERLPELTDSGRYPVAVVHGRLSTEEKDRAMAAFAAGRAPILVATTVIEVGIDVPAATMMIIFDADRFGLAQLHQLRGRVGRSDQPGLCLLVTRADDGPSRQRLDVVAGTTDGFALAAEDLRVRREGDVLGAAQSGAATSLRFLRVIEHEDVILEARAQAERLIEHDPTLTAFPGLLAAIATLDPEREEYLGRY